MVYSSRPMNGENSSFLLAACHRCERQRGCNGLRFSMREKERERVVLKARASERVLLCNGGIRMQGYFSLFFALFVANGARGL